MQDVYLFGRVSYHDESLDRDALFATPQLVHDLLPTTRVRGVAVGHQRTVLLCDDGAFQWGRAFGRTVDDNERFRPRMLLFSDVNFNPAAVPLRVVVSEVFCGRHHAMLLGLDQSLWALGSNKYGQLGLGKRVPSQTNPSRITFPDPTPDRIVTVSLGDAHSLAASGDGRTFVWGRDVAQTRWTPVVVDDEVLGQVTAVKVAAGPAHSAVLSLQGMVYVWGALSESIRLETPTKLSSSSYMDAVITDIDCGRGFVALLSADGDAFVWIPSQEETVAYTSPIRIDGASPCAEMRAGPDRLALIDKTRRTVRIFYVPSRRLVLMPGDYGRIERVAIGSLHGVIVANPNHGDTAPSQLEPCTQYSDMELAPGLWVHKVVLNVRVPALLRMEALRNLRTAVRWAYAGAIESGDLKHAVNNPEYADVAFRLLRDRHRGGGDDDDDQLVYAHRYILSTRAPFFRAMFDFHHQQRRARGDYGDDDDDDEKKLPVIDVDECSRDAFLALLEWLYTDRIPSAVEANMRMLVELLVLSGQYCCHDLQRVCEVTLFRLIQQQQQQRALKMQSSRRGGADAAGRAVASDDRRHGRGEVLLVARESKHMAAAKRLFDDVLTMPDKKSESDSDNDEEKTVRDTPVHVWVAFAEQHNCQRLKDLLLSHVGTLDAPLSPVVAGAGPASGTGDPAHWEALAEVIDHVVTKSRQERNQSAPEVDIDIESRVVMRDDFAVMEKPYTYVLTLNVLVTLSYFVATLLVLWQVDSPGTGPSWVAPALVVCIGSACTIALRWFNFRHRSMFSSHWFRSRAHDKKRQRLEQTKAILSSLHGEVDAVPPEGCGALAATRAAIREEMGMVDVELMLARERVGSSSPTPSLQDKATLVIACVSSMSIAAFSIATASALEDGSDTVSHWASWSPLFVLDGALLSVLVYYGTQYVRRSAAATAGVECRWGLLILIVLNCVVQVVLSPSGITIVQSLFLAGKIAFGATYSWTTALMPLIVSTSLALAPFALLYVITATLALVALVLPPVRRVTREAVVEFLDEHPHIDLVAVTAVLIQAVAGSLLGAVVLVAIRLDGTRDVSAVEMGVPCVFFFASVFASTAWMFRLRVWAWKNYAHVWRS